MNFYPLLLKIWRLFPRSIRKAVQIYVILLIAPKPDPIEKIQSGNVIVAGLLTSTIGLGESARICSKALKQIGYEVSHLDFSKYLGMSDLPGAEKYNDPVRPDEGGTIILHLNPPINLFAYHLMGRQMVKRKRVIGLWHWELPVVPSNWRRSEPFVHEIWAPSKFTAEAIAQVLKTPMKIVTHPVTMPSTFKKSRKDFGLPGDAFLVFTTFHMGSIFKRKNPVATIRSFKMAFGNALDYMLVLKVADEKIAPWAMRILREEIGGSENIRIISDKLSNEDMAELINCADVIISLHRSEGFGLLPAQGMLLGKVVIATGWSGNIDFMSENNSKLIGYKLIPVEDPQGTYNMKNLVWADPDLEEAAHWLKKMADDKELRNQLGRIAAKEAKEIFSFEAYKKVIADSF